MCHAHLDGRNAAGLERSETGLQRPLQQRLSRCYSNDFSTRTGSRRNSADALSRVASRQCAMQASGNFRKSEQRPWRHHILARNPAERSALDQTSAIRYTGSVWHGDCAAYVRTAGTRTILPYPSRVPGIRHTLSVSGQMPSVALQHHIERDRQARRIGGIRMHHVVQPGRPQQQGAG